MTNKNSQNIKENDWINNNKNLMNDNHDDEASINNRNSIKDNYNNTTNVKQQEMRR